IPVAASGASAAIAVLMLATADPMVSVVAMARDKSLAAEPFRPAPRIRTFTVSAAAGAENAAPAVAVTLATLPVEPLEKLPSNAVETRSPPCTWNAVDAALNVNCCLPFASVLIAAVMLAFLTAVACWLAPLPAFWIASNRGQERQHH